MRRKQQNLAYVERSIGAGQIEVIDIEEVEERSRQQTAAWLARVAAAADKEECMSVFVDMLEWELDIEKRIARRYLSPDRTREAFD